MSADETGRTGLRRAWAALVPGLRILEPLAFRPEEWALLERLHARFDDRKAHARLPIPIARFKDAARREILAIAQRQDEVRTGSLGDAGPADAAADDPMAPHVRGFNHDVDAMLRVLVPAARHRKGHHAYGLFTAPEPHGLHTDHSAEDPAAGGEPICIARVGTLGTHYVAGDERDHDARTAAMLRSLRYWTPGPEGEDPEEVLTCLLRRDLMRTIPVDHVVLMVAGNAAESVQVTQHIAARPPPGGLHSAFFQRQYRLAPAP